LFDEEVLQGIGLAPPRPDAPLAVRLQLRLPWYRSLPLSCIERLSVAIDGEEQTEDRLRVVVNGELRSLHEVAEMHEVWWFVLDTVDLQIASTGGLEPGKHEVRVGLQLRIPYGDPHFRDFECSQVAECTKELELLGKDE
jgi:hypothetical protein